MADLRVYQRGSTWTYSFEIDPTTRKRVSKGGYKTKREATIEGTKAKAIYDNGGVAPIDTSSITIQQLCDTYLKEKAYYEVSEKTYENYESICRIHIVPKLGIYKVSSITPNSIRDFVNYLYDEKKLSEGRIKLILVVLKNAFNYAIDPLNIIIMSPVQNIKLRKKKNAVRKKGTKKLKLVSMDDYKRILEILPRGEVRNIICQIAFHTGMRASEILGLEWHDVDLKNNVIHVVQQVQNYRKSKKQFICDIKSSTSYRDITIDEHLAKELNYYKKQQLKRQLQLGSECIMNYAVKEMYKNELMEYVVHEEVKGARQTNFVCLKNDGLNCDYNQIKLLIRYLQRNVNKQFDVHSLRHTHATMLIENGVPVKTVQERLGHENIETTLNTYVHNTDSMNKIAVDTISQIVSKNNIV